MSTTAIINGSKGMVSAGWDDVPHLDAQTKTELLNATPPYLREARRNGAPSLGQGAIYPFVEDEIKCAPFAVPPHWFRGYGMDVGWNRTAAVWGALDRDTDILYLTSEYYRGQAEPSVHSSAIKTRGDWMPGFIDPASKGRSQKDGEQLFALYVALGLKIETADNGVEAGILDVYDRLSTGRLKVFSTLLNWFGEYRLYRRDEHGKIVKKNDHLMDATRYLCRPTSLLAMKQRPSVVRPAHTFGAGVGSSESVAGY